MAAAVAEVAVRRVCPAALRTGSLQFTAAFVAETGISGIIGLAYRALHFSFSNRRRTLILIFKNN
jgi:hypothetical protein